jgi:hypothetical protein
MTSDELDRRIIAYKRGSKPARTFHTPLDTKIADYYRQHPEARAAVEKVRADPRGVAAVVRDTVSMFGNRMVGGRHYVGGSIISVR